MPISNDCHNLLLKIDLMGIGVMLFGLTLIAVFLGFHNWPIERLYTMTLIASMFVINLGIQMTPCYVE